jgi:hypothetical protein
MLAEGLITLLRADSGVIAANTRADGSIGQIFAGQMPPEALPPVTVYGFAYEENEMTMDGPDAFSKARIELWHQGADYAQAKKLARAVRKCLENFRGTLSDGSEVDSIRRISELDTFQDAPFLYLTSVEYEVSYRDLGT